MQLRAAFVSALLLAACGDNGANLTDGPAPDASPDAPAQWDAALDAWVCSTTPTHPLTTVRTPAVDLLANGDQTITVGNGFLLQGTVTLPNVPGNAHPSGSWVLAYDDATGTLYHSFDSSDAMQGSFHYQMILPAGHYRMKYTHVVWIIKDPNSSTWGEYYGRNGYDEIDVCGDATHDVTLQELGSFTSQEIVVHGLDRIGPPPWSIDVLYTDQGDTIGYSNDEISVSAPNAPATLDLPAGVTLAKAYGAEFTGSSLYDLTVPPMITVSGTLSNSTALTPDSMTAGCILPIAQVYPDPFELGVTGLGDPASVRETFQGQMYSAVMPQGVSCSLVLMADFSAAPAGTLVIPDPSPMVAETFSADTTRDLVLPDLSSATITVHVRDANGQPLGMYEVYGVSTALVGAAAGGRFVSNYALSDAGGQGQIRVVPGRYQLVAQLQSQ